ncbi:Ectopic P granules protein 5 [Linnemannia zychae]|nr:Ectopic P granules protein 5 [Linnemannia zychae]
MAEFSNYGNTYYSDSNDSFKYNEDDESKSSAALYPLIPPLPQPFSSSYSHTFQPSAPPSEPLSPPVDSPWATASAPIFPSVDSPEYSPPYVPSYPTDYIADHQAEYGAFGSPRNPWHALSQSPIKEDLQPENSLYPVPSAPSLPTILSTEPNQYQETLYPHSNWNKHYNDNHDCSPNYPRLESSLLLQHSSPSVSAERLRELYNNNFLQELSGRLSDYEHTSLTRSTGDSNNSDEFFHRLKAYESAHEAIQQLYLSIFNLQHKAKGYASKLWVVQTKSEIVKASCGDGNTIAHNYTYQVGRHEPGVAEKLKKSLARLHKQRTKNLLRVQYEESSNRLWIQDHLAEFLSSVKWESERDAGLQKARGYLDILFQIERNVRRLPDFDASVEEQSIISQGADEMITEKSSDERKADSIPSSTTINSILHSIHGWIGLLAGAVLTFGGFQEREYLIVQVLLSQQIANWAVNYVQCGAPNVWSLDFEDFYLSELQLVLCGSDPPNGGSSKLSVSDSSLNIGSTLDEDDYSALLDQMDVAVFFNQFLDEHSGMHNYDGTLYQKELSEHEALRVLTTTRRIFDIILHGLQRHINFPVVAKRLSQTLCQLAQILGDHLLILGPIRSKLISGEILSITLDSYNHKTTTLQLEVDNILLDVTRTLLTLPNLGLWTFLPSIPYKYMSNASVALILEEIALDNIQEWIAQPSGLLSVGPESNKLRDSLGQNPGEAVFLLSAIATLATSRFQGVSTQECVLFRASIQDSIASIAAFLLLDVGYLDKDIRGELSKPVREILRSLCDSHAGVISFILCFVKEHFEEMGDMAQYLFKELSFDEWNISSADFITLQQFLETPPLSSQQSLFARFILSSLPWTQGNIGEESSRDQVIVPQHFRKELALTLADICIQHITKISAEAESAAKEATGIPNDDHIISPMRLKSLEHTFMGSLTSSLPHAITHLAAHSGLHRTAEQTAIKIFMDWCWTVLIKLELLDVPTLNLLEASRLQVQDPGLAKFALFSQGQLTFVNTVHLLLTEASRDAEQFLEEGWTTIIAILHVEAGSVLLNLVSRLIPSIIFSGSDLTPHAAKFGQFLRDFVGLKQDTIHNIASKTQHPSMNRFIIAKDMIGLYSLLNAHLEYGLNRSGGGDVTVIKFWMAAVFSQKEWVTHQNCVQVMDAICHVAFELNHHTLIKDALMEQQILLSIGFRRAPGVSAELMGLAQPGLDRVMDMLPERFVKALPVAVPQGLSDPSLLMGTWSVKAFATNLFTQQAMVETTSIWFAYYALLVETNLERHMRIKVGSYYQQHQSDIQVHGNIKTIVKTLRITSRKTLQNFSIWRWAQHLLILPVDTFLLPLFWQMFFFLYFGHTEHPSIYYGYKFLETNPEIIAQLKNRLQKIYTHFGEEARKAIQAQNVKNAASLTALHEFYIALYGWISEPLLLTPDIDLRRIRKDLMPDLLATCRIPDPLECNFDSWKGFLLFDQNDIKLTNADSTPPSSSGSSHQGVGRSQLSGSKDSNQSRAIRKHSHAWFEQKIVSCITKQSKAGPEFFLPRVQVPPMIINADTTPRGLFGQSLRTIRDCSKKYMETSEAYNNLDVVYLSELGSLYRNEIKTKRIEVACDTTPNALCVRPAVIELQYEEIILNDKVKDLIVENRQRARELKLGSIEQGLCLATLEISKIINTLLNRLELEPSNVALQTLSMQSFYHLCNELLGDASTYPPVFVLLTSIVKSLGMDVVAKDPNQTESILDLMQTDDFRISLLFKAFYPAALPSEFVRLYQRIATCKDYGLASKDRLLRQFDVQAWACEPVSDVFTSASDQQDKPSGPSVLDRLAFYEVAFTAMVAQQQLQKHDDKFQESTELSTRDRLAIIKSHRELAGTLFLNFLQQDYVEYLRILFDTCGIMCLEPEVLEDFIRILGVEPTLIPSLLDGTDTLEEALYSGGNAMTKVGLSDYDLGRLVQFLADYFVECQENLVRGNLLDRYSGYAVSIASLLTAILCDERYFTKWIKPFPESFGYSISGYVQTTATNTDWLERDRRADLLVSLSQCRVYHDTLMVFRPWLSCITDRAVDEIRFQRQQGGASRLLFTFVGIVSKMMITLKARFNDISIMSQEIFDFWLELTEQSTKGEGSINQTMLLHQHFHRLDWTGLELCKERVDRILDVKAKLGVEIRVDFWTYLVTVLMEGAGSDLRPRRLKRIEMKAAMEWQQTEAAFMRLGIAVLQDIDLIAGGDLEVRQQFLNRIWSTIFDTGDWALLPNDELTHQVSELKVYWDRAGMLDDMTSPLGLMLYWMRITVGLESTDMTELHQNEAINQLRPDRVLIYFGYVSQLLQVTLASSTKDSLSVNFSVEAIPSVIVHLGSVLDRIAGSRHHVRHPDIHRSLLALISCLNQCEPKPTTQSLSPSSSSNSTTYDMVLRGMKYMISDVEVIQLDVIRALCQRLNSIPVMVNLLEEVIEREFDLWAGEQGGQHDTMQFSGLMSTSVSTFGLENTPLHQTIYPMSLIGHIRSNSSHSDHQRTNSGDGRHSWSKIKAQIEAPELTEDEFLDEAFKQGAILTIYGRFLQLLDECEQSQDFDEVLELGQELAEVISKVNILVIEPWKAYQSLLLLRMFLTLVAKESVHSVLQSRFLNSVMQVCRTLELWFQDRDSTKGVLSSIGMGSRSTLDIKFRMVVRIIYTYLVVRLVDKGLSIHRGADTGHAGSGGGVLAWRKGRQNSVQSQGDSSSTSGSSSRDTSAALIDALAQLPIKNKDYALVFTAPIAASDSAQKVGSASTAIALLPALASSPLDIVKRSIMSTPPPLIHGSPSKKSGPSPTSTASTPTFGSERRNNNFGNNGKIIGHNKRLSVQSGHSRFSTTSSWDDTAGTILFPDEMIDHAANRISTLSMSTTPINTGELVATRRRVFGSSHHQQQPTEYRIRLQQGTKNGTEDLVWAVERIKDRRFRILEAADFMEEVLDRFYEGDDYFA